MILPIPNKWSSRDRPPLVLFVDDEEALVRAYGSELVTNFGYEVVPCLNAARAISAAEQYSVFVDIIIMDIRLGKDDGVRIAKKMLKVCPNAKVVFISGDPTALDGNLPGTRLIKPFTVIDLDHALRVLVLGNGA